MILIFEYSNFQHVPQTCSWLQIQVVIKNTMIFAICTNEEFIKVTQAHNKMVQAHMQRWFTKMWNMIFKSQLRKKKIQIQHLAIYQVKQWENPFTSTTFKLHHKVWVTKIVSSSNNSITPTNALVISTSTNFNGALKLKTLPHVNAILTSVSHMSISRLFVEDHLLPWCFWLIPKKTCWIEGKTNNSWKSCNKCWKLASLNPT